MPKNPKEGCSSLVGIGFHLRGFKLQGPRSGVGVSEFNGGVQ